MNVLRISLAVAIVFAISAPACAEVRYVITDLGTVGGRGGDAYAINDLGQVVGCDLAWDGYNNVKKAFLWDSTNGMQILGTLGGKWSTALDINENEQVVGYARTEFDYDHAFMYENDLMQDLSPGLAGFSVAYAINDDATVVGDTWASGSPCSAFVYADGLTDVFGPNGSNARDINNLGQIVGGCPTELYGQAYMYMDGVWTILGCLYHPQFASGATAINSVGQIVGKSQAQPTGHYHAFLYSNGVMEDLGVLGGLTSEAFGVNDIGDVVGVSDYRAFIYSDGVMTDLNTLIDPDSGWILEIARDINNLGQIVGRGIFDGQDERAFLLTIIPEPMTVTLLALGGLILFRQKRRKPSP